MVDPLRKKCMNCLNSDEGGLWPENDLGEVMCLLTKDN